MLPYEILKGKLLGEIDKLEVDKFADFWENSLRPIEARPEGEVDNFFRSYLKAKFTETRKQGQVFDGQYHRTIFQNAFSGPAALLGNSLRVKEFLQGPLTYYAALFLKIRRLGETLGNVSPECYYLSQLNRMDGHLMLILATCQVNDPDEQQKISAVARAIDRAYVMLQLNRVYDSNGFQELLYTLHPALRSCPANEIEGIINLRILNEIKQRRNTDQTSLLSYGQFKQVGYGDYNSTFLRYFLARLETFIAEGLHLSLQDTLYNFVRGIGKNNGYHVEHILSKNTESRSLFRTPSGSIDEALFENERNRFGGLLLLRGVDNQAAGNEKYALKLKTYGATAPLLARSLTPDFYKANTALKVLNHDFDLDFRAVPNFGLEELEERSQLLFAMTQLIWGV